MQPGRPRAARDAALVGAAATVLAAAIAWPVLLSPSTRLIGDEIVGRHPDPFVLARQFELGQIPPPYLQPAVDWPAMALARLTDGITAHNIVTLVSFPLAALFTYLLVIELTRSRVAAVGAALWFTWAPVHTAHAAYHAHIAQVQWWPLALWALLRAVRGPVARGVPAALASLVLLAAASWYWAWFAVLLAPVAVAASAWFRPVPEERLDRTALVTLLACLAALAVAAVAVATSQSVGTPAVGADDLQWYSARWMSLILPAVTHPWLGETVAAYWARQDVGPGVLEQQVGPAVTTLVLAAVGVAAWWRSPRQPLLTAVPWLLIVGGAGAVVAVHGADLAGGVAPMFRAYARAGVVTTLTLAVLAGVGLAVIGRGPMGRAAVVVLLICGALELLPAARQWRPIWPTPAHAWVAEHTPGAGLLDCTAPGRIYAASVRPVMGDRVRFREAPFDDCAAPELGGMLAAHGVRYVILRRSLREAQWLDHGGSLDGLERAAEFPEALVIVVTAPPASVYTTHAGALSVRQFDGPATWRLMPQTPTEWLVMNRHSSPVHAVLEVMASATADPRTLRVQLGDQTVSARVGPHGTYELGPLMLPPGESRLTVLMDPDDARTDSTIRLERWQWIPQQAETVLLGGLTRPRVR